MRSRRSNPSWMRASAREANPIAAVAIVAVVCALIIAFGWWAYTEDQKWQRHCTGELHGSVQTQHWSGYGFHTGSSGKMVYGYYSTSTTVCRLTSGPNAGAIVDTE